MRAKTYSLRTLVLVVIFIAALVGLISIDLSTKQIAGSFNEEDVLNKAADIALIMRNDPHAHHHHDHDDDDEEVNTVKAEDEEEVRQAMLVEEADNVNADQEEDIEGQQDEEDEEPSIGPFLRSRGDSLSRSKSWTFGVRHGHRLAHVEARKQRNRGILGPGGQRKKYANPVIEDAEHDLLPFHEKFVREAFRKTPRIEMEAEYFRFEDTLGLIDTGWNDDKVLYALQRLVDIYAQANIRIRIRKSEALARVKLSRERSLAYWFYVDYPKNRAMSRERRERRELMQKVIGMDLITLFEALDKERQGLFDWIAGYPEERTPWENENVVGMYPSFYYFFMNGGGEGGCMRFRTGDCNTPKQIKGVEGGKLNVYCYRLDIVRKARTTEVPIVRSWERYNFTANMAIRLVAHEMGHAMTLRHPNKGCVNVHNWDMGNLMSQVMTMAGPGRTCRVTGWPDLAARATYLTDEQIAMAREAVMKDLRETATVPGSYKVGKTTEVKAVACSEKGRPILGFFASSLPAPESGTVTRIRWKSGRNFAIGDRLKISVGKMSPDGKWTEKHSEVVKPHTMGKFVHQEHDVSLPVTKGDMIGIFMVIKPRGKPSASEDDGLVPETHYYEDPDALGADVVGEVPVSKRVHPTINQVMSAIDKNTIYPQVVPRAQPDSKAMVLTDEGWKPAGCAEWVFNYDLDNTVPSEIASAS